MNYTIITSSLLIIFFQSTAMVLPEKMREYINQQKSSKNICYLFYSVKLNQNTNVNTMTHDVKAAVGEQDYMGDIVQTSSNNNKYLTIFMLGEEKNVKQRLSNKSWFKEGELISDALISNADLDNK
jgi:hypothetical protein